MTTKMTIEQIVNMDKYPISDKQALAYATLVMRCRNDLADKMYCVIPNFLSSEALNAMAIEASVLRPAAYDNNSRRNCYLHRQEDPSLPP